MRGILRRLGVEKRGDDILQLFGVRLADNLISWNYLQPLEPRLKAISLTVPKQMIAEIHPADIAEIITSVSREEGTTLFRELDIEAAAETLSELEPEVQTKIIDEIGPEQASNIIEMMEPDDAAEVLNDLPADKVKMILELLEKEDAEDIQELLTHEEDTAGGLMTNEFLSYPPETTVAEVFSRFKIDAEDASSDVDYDMTPAGVISAFNAVYPGADTSYERLKNIFEDYNEQGCPLNRGIDPSASEPTAHRLLQNYPNPFNPTTEIGFQVPPFGQGRSGMAAGENTWVELKVYDVLGQEVATLVDGMRTAGRHQVEFDGSKQTSGVYFYRLETGAFSRVMKLLLMK